MELAAHSRSSQRSAPRSKARKVIKVSVNKAGLDSNFVLFEYEKRQTYTIKHPGRIAFPFALKTTAMKKILIETERLILSELAYQDAAFILQLLNDTDFLRFIGDRNIRTLESARNYINGPRASYEKNGFGLWLVQDRTGTSLGICGLIKRDSLPDVDIGYAFLSEFRSQGFAFEAARASLAFGRDMLKLKRILAIVSPENERSVHLLEKLGMKFERMVSMPNDSAELKLFAMEFAIG